MKIIYTYILIGLISLIGGSLLYAGTASTGPSGENKDGRFYEYFMSITKTPDSILVNPYFTGFSLDFTSQYGDGNNFIKNYLATLGFSSTGIVTGFNPGGEIQTGSIDSFMRSWLGSTPTNPTPNSAIIGFSSTTGRPIYSREVGYWTSIPGGISYVGGVQIGESISPGSLSVANNNITINSAPTLDDDLVNKAYVDNYLSSMCTRFLGTWDASTSRCSKNGSGNEGGSTPPICTPGTWGVCTGTCGDNKGTQSRTDSCGNIENRSCTVSTCSSTPTCSDGIQNQGETQVDCGGLNCGACNTNSCSSILPTCNGVSCTTTIGTPTSANQAWTKGSLNCGFSCTGGYTGVNCEIAPTLKCTGLGAKIGWDTSGSWSVGQGSECWGYTSACNNTNEGATCMISSPTGHIGTLDLKCQNGNWKTMSVSCDNISVPFKGCRASDGDMITHGSYFLDGNMYICDDGNAVLDVTNCGNIITPTNIFNVPDHSSPIHKRSWCDRG